MEFRFKNASCVAVGSFNVYIIQPAWLIENGIVVADRDEIGIEVNMAEPGFRIVCPGDAVIWRVHPNRISIEAGNASVDCGESMALVLERLPHTPLRAIGSNVQYDGSKEAADRFFGGLPDVVGKLRENEKLVQQTRHLAIAEGDQVFNLSVAAKSDALQLHANIHTDLAGKKSPFPERTAASFLEHRQRAERLFSELFDVRLSYGAADNGS